MNQIEDCAFFARAREVFLFNAQRVAERKADLEASLSTLPT